MNLPRYELKSDNTFTVFEFKSEGAKGTIPKLISFSETDLSGLFNLAFGDLDKKTGEINDSVISNNGDRDKILATIVASVYSFTNRYPTAWVYATGSTHARTRLYRMGITKYMVEIKNDFMIYGMRDSEWEIFEKGIAYDAFLVKRLTL